MRRSLLTDRAKFRRREPGFIITLVAVFLLFVVGAMAALSIDIASFYTARSEAQIAADAAALAGARALANSGMTSSTDATMLSKAITLCQNFGASVGGSSQVGGQSVAGHITVTCSSTQQGNPTVRAQVNVTVPAFFARIWGTTQASIAASATAEAYNPSGLATGLNTSQPPPVAVSCVKPWLLPNIDPLNTSIGIFAPGSGAINDTNLLGSQQPGMLVNCPASGCTPPHPTPAAWSYYPGDTSPSGMFAAPPPNSVSCSPSTTGFTPTDYQLAVAGCVQTPIPCNTTSVAIDLNAYTGRDADTFAAVNCLSHSATNAGDKIDVTTFPAGPFEFLVGDENPLVAAGLTSGSDVVVSDSLVTVPVFDTPSFNGTTVNLIGFVQLFLNPDGNPAPNGGQISTTVVNLVGCGTNSSGNPIYGNGAAAVPVRLITPP